MILTVTLNAALDVTYPVAQLSPGATHRVDAPHQRAGGKGINVARVLHNASRATLATGLLGGSTGVQMRAELGVAGVPHDFTEIKDETRRTVTIVTGGSATAFNEAGPHVTSDEWQHFLTTFERLLSTADVVVCSGSLPPDLPTGQPTHQPTGQSTGHPARQPTGAYTTLCRIAAQHALPVIVDATGEALLAALPARPALVTPNRDELLETTGTRDPLDGAARLRDLGAQAVVVTLGERGLVAVTDEGTWHAQPPRALAGNPTGAGDAAVAALATGIADRTPWPQRLIAATAWSAGAVLGPYAGDVDEGIRREFADQTVVTQEPTIEEIHDSDAHR
jgi:tagatose 6-phosphate kinase